MHKTSASSSIGRCRCNTGDQRGGGLIQQTAVHQTQWRGRGARNDLLVSHGNGCGRVWRVYGEYRRSQTGHIREDVLRCFKQGVARPATILTSVIRRWAMSVCCLLVAWGRGLRFHCRSLARRRQRRSGVSKRRRHGLAQQHHGKRYAADQPARKHGTHHELILSGIVVTYVTI